ncbi:hypothetical protein [Pseudomonas protegens]|uniref:hypothetical protein n=1 Tax=Pseudomonas protegens TaxID=380021 RepID=UPI00274CC35E|nr:hypothetical protein [Pseudomonas protegens]MDP9517742.1 hypothetical protein [Pseudomonas protegens]
MQAKSSTLTQAEFDSVIDNVASFFKGDKGGVDYRSLSYSATSGETHELYEKLGLVYVDITSSNNNEVAQVVGRLNSEFQKELSADSNGYHKDITECTNNLESTRNQDDFNKRIDDIAANAKAASAATIDKWKEKVKKYYKESSTLGQRVLDALMGAFAKACALAMKVYESIINFFTSIIANVVKWLEHAWASIKDFFSGISRMISSLL